MSQPSQTSQHSDDKPVYPAVNYLNADRGVKSWLLTLDHKRIGVMYLCSVLVMFLLGGIFAMAIRLELLTPEPTIMGANTYNRMFTLHGVIMIFLFMIPAIPGVFGNFCMPLMLGAKDVAFPKLNLLSLYLYWTGAILALTAMLMGGVDTGWTFYAPYSTTTPMTVFPALLGVFILGFSSIVTGLNFIVTIHTLRAPGLTWMRMQLFVWAIYATSIIQVLATPVIGLTVMLVGIEKVGGFGLFDATKGGDPVLFQHMFWFYSHPAVYIMVLPSMGVVSDAIAAFSRKNVFGYKMIAYSSLGIAFVGFFAWGHHMFTSGQSPFDNGAFAVISMFVGVFTAIKVFNWVGTLYRGAILVSAPFIYICGFLFFVVFGGMTGIAVATVSLDVHWHDTYFVVAHFHFIMVGAVIMGFLIAIHYWFPKMFGRKYHEGWGMVAASLHRARLHRDVHPAVPRRQRGHAAPLLHVPGAVPGDERRVDGRVVAAGVRVRHHRHLPDLRADARRDRGRQPLELARHRVDDHLAAVEGQLRQAAGRHAGPALVPEAGRGGGACRHLTVTPTTRISRTTSTRSRSRTTPPAWACGCSSGPKCCCSPACSSATRSTGTSITTPFTTARARWTSSSARSTPSS